MFEPTRNSDTVALQVLSLLIQRELNEPTGLTLELAKLYSVDYGRLQTSLAKYVDLYSGIAARRKRYDELGEIGRLTNFAPSRVQTLPTPVPTRASTFTTPLTDEEYAARVADAKTEIAARTANHVKPIQGESVDDYRARVKAARTLTAKNIHPDDTVSPSTNFFGAGSSEDTSE